MWITLATVSLLFAGASTTVNPKTGKPMPNIVTIIADDLGYNDVSYHGSNQIPTPNIDALAYSGVILDRHYVLPVCTPSRTAFLTGVHPVRTGMQGWPLKAGEPRALSLEFPTLANQMSRLGYRTHLVGKWHLGCYQSVFTPPARGYDSFLGYWNGYVSYFGYNVTMDQPDALEKNLRGFDLHEDARPAWEMEGRYATDLFTERAEQLIAKHDPAGGPLYLQLAHLAPHAGYNGTELEVPDQAHTDQRFAYISEQPRRQLAGVMEELDKSVGRVVSALERHGLLNNTIILFFADNGGETLGGHKNYASNWPLRGQKYTLYDGGVRGAAALWTPWLARPNSVHRDLVHITDWMPTFYEAAGGDLADLGDIDGVSQWGAFMGTPAKPPRTEHLVNIDLSAAIIRGGWKLVRGEQKPDLSQMVGDSGRGPMIPKYDADAVVASPTAEALARTASTASQGLTEYLVHSLRARAQLPDDCRPASLPDSLPTACDPFCLYDLNTDPCEVHDVADRHPDIALDLLQRLRMWDARAVPQLNTDVDQRSDPTAPGRNGTWVPWMDKEPPQPSSTGVPDVGAPPPGALFSLLLAGLLACFLHYAP